MPQVSTIAISDGAATPVSHTFSPIGKDAKGVLWFEQTSPVPSSTIGAKRIGYRQVRADPMSRRLDGNSKVVLTLHVPTPESLATSDSGLVPPPTLAYKQVARVELDLPERGAKQERKDTRLLTLNLLNTVLASQIIDDLQPIYGG